MGIRIRLFFLLTCLCVGISNYSFSQSPPNIVFLLADDLGYGDLSSYEHPFIQTPNLDQLANEGMRFTNFYSPSPLCSPSRAGFLTGRIPFRTGIESWIPQGEGIYLHKEEITIASLLRENGYQTYLSGKWHLNGGLEEAKHAQPQDHGFPDWLANHAFALPTHKDPNNFYRNGEAEGVMEGFCAQIVVDDAMTWLDRRDESKPFFLYLPFNEPHTEIASPDSFLQKYSDFTAGEVDLDSLYNRGPGEYYANINHLDYQIGRLLKRLDQLGLTENTLIIFTSDNGPVTTEWRHWWEVNMYGSTGGLRGRKADLFEGGIRVPCIIKYPGSDVAGKVVDTPLHGYDLFPTLCALTGIPAPTDRELDGVDFSPLLNGHSFTRSKPLFWAFHTRPGDNPEGYSFAIRDGDWKLITDQTLSKTLLYNLRKDPYEVRELSKAEPEKVRELLLQVREKVQSVYADPLLPR